jgi:hypothetical protein
MQQKRGFVTVRGAREHNLKDVSLEIPRDALVVFTGVSGSGKSSLAFGTLYAEAQRRYLESVSPYARRLPLRCDARHCRERPPGEAPVIRCAATHSATVACVCADDGKFMISSGTRA